MVNGYSRSHNLAIMVTVGRYCIRDNCQWSMLTVEDYLADKET